MPDVVIFPDAEQIVLDHLDDEMGVDVGSHVPNPRPTEFLLVRRLGGPRMNEVADNAMLGVEAWGASVAAAHDLIQEARGLILAMRGTVHSGVAVYRITEIGGPAQLPDPLSDQPRYTYTVQVAMRGSVSGS